MSYNRLELENELNENGLTQKYENIENLRMDIKDIGSIMPTTSKAMLLREIFCIIDDKNILIFTGKETSIIIFFLYSLKKILINENELIFLLSVLNFTTLEKELFFKKIKKFKKENNYEIILKEYRFTYCSELIETLKNKTSLYILNKYNKHFFSLEEKANQIQRNIDLNLIKTIEILGIFVSIFTLISINANFFSTNNIDNIKKFLIINGTTVFSLSVLLLLVYPKVSICIKVLGVLIFLIFLTIVYIFI